MESDNDYSSASKLYNLKAAKLSNISMRGSKKKINWNIKNPMAPIARPKHSQQKSSDYLAEKRMIRNSGGISSQRSSSMYNLQSRLNDQFENEDFTTD